MEKPGYESYLTKLKVSKDLANFKGELIQEDSASINPEELEFSTNNPDDLKARVNWNQILQKISPGRRHKALQSQRTSSADCL